jgi:peptidyl-prolyl cis-trans isomerase SurA
MSATCRLSQTRLISTLALSVAFAHPALAQDKPAAPPSGEPRLDRRLPEAPTGARANDRVFTLDRIIAVVNDEVITQLELNNRLNIVLQQLRKQGTELPARQTLARQILERMVGDQVQFQLAKETGLRVDDAQVDRAMQRIASDNKLSVAEFRSALEADGVSFNAFREDIRSEILLARLREREVDNKVVVGEAEVESEVEAQSQRAVPDEEFLLAHVLVQIPDQASAEVIEARKKKADQAFNALKGGADFAQVSASFSDAPEALQGGNLGWRTPARLPKLFVDAVANLTKGQTSEVLKSANGFHIVRVLDKRGKDVAQIINQTKARHILVKVSEIVSEEDAQRRALELKQRLDNGADFAELAKQSSEDASGPSGGDLGWVSPGDTVPEFERTMDGLDINKISDPVRTPFGWHVIQVLERRQQDVTAERGRLAARQGLRQRKADEAYQDWLRQLRDRAYIEYRLEER